VSIPNREWKWQAIGSIQAAAALVVIASRENLTLDHKSAPVQKGRTPGGPARLGELDPELARTRVGFTRIRFSRNGKDLRESKWPSWPHPTSNADEPRVKTAKRPAMKTPFRAVSFTEKLRSK